MVTNEIKYTKLRHLFGLLSVLTFLVLGKTSQAQVNMGIANYVKEGISVMIPAYGKTVKGKHFLEIYDTWYDDVKKINFIVDLATKPTNQSEIEYLEQIKKTLSGNAIIKTDLSTVKKNRRGFPYRSLKVEYGKGIRYFFFFFRGDEVALLTYQYLAKDDNYLDGTIDYAVDEFWWLDKPMTINGTGVSFKLPYSMNVTVDEKAKIIEIDFKDPILYKDTGFGATLEYTSIDGQIDSTSVRAAMSTYLKTHQPKLTLQSKMFKTKFNDTYNSDFYMIEYDVNNRKVKKNIHQIYTNKGIIRFAYSEWRVRSTPSTKEAWDSILRLIKSVRYEN